jgi:hypothetical protein
LFSITPSSATRAQYMRIPHKGAARTRRFECIVTVVMADMITDNAHALWVLLVTLPTMQLVALVALSGPAVVRMHVLTPAFQLDDFVARHFIRLLQCVFAPTPTVPRATSMAVIPYTICRFNTTRTTAYTSQGVSHQIWSHRTHCPKRAFVCR